MLLNKENINIIKLLCGLIPKTAPSNISTMLFIININNQYVIYGGDSSIIKCIYYTDITCDNTSLHIGIIAYTFAAALKTIKKNIECSFVNNHIIWKEDNNTTNLKSLDINNAMNSMNFSLLKSIVIDMNEFVNAIKSVNIKIDTLTTKCYIHITNEFIRFIIMDAGRLSISNTIKCNSPYNLFAICNYEALLSLIPLLTTVQIELYINNNILIIKQNNIELQISINKTNYINYTKYLNTNAISFTVNTNILYNALKSLAYINKSQTEIITFTSQNDNIILECYNPNIGSRQISMNIIEGTLNRTLKFSLAWLTDAIKTINSDTCKLVYGDVAIHPLIIQSENIHVIAPIITH